MSTSAPTLRPFSPATTASRALLFSTPKRQASGVPPQALVRKTVQGLTAMRRPEAHSTR